MFRSLSRATALAAITAIFCAATSSALFASSHREAPFITEMPKVDGSDFYMFRSYGPNSTPDSVTFIANYQPLQDAYGGPNYFTMDPNALYEIHVDNDGDTREDITFQFRFETTFRGASLPIGPEDGDGNPTNIPIALTNVGVAGNTSAVGPGVNDNAGLNVVENYRVNVVRGDRRSAIDPPVTTNLNPSTADDTELFRKPVDNIGNKTIPDYAAYANNHVFGIDFDPNLPQCGDETGRVFVGQRRDGFVVNLGEIFDRVNLDPLGARNSAANIIADKNVTSIALEVPLSCLQQAVIATPEGEDPAQPEPVIGAWTTASLRQARVLNPLPLAPGQQNTDDPSAVSQDNEINTPAVEGGAWTQVSRLGHPLVNEVIIGLNQKDQFNASEPANDLIQFGAFVTNPTLPVLISALFPSVATPDTPRNDLISTFITGIRTSVAGEDTNFTQPRLLTITNADTDEDGIIAPNEELRLGGEILRLNTAFPAGTPPALAAQNDLGFLACDLDGFPNGRRPIDDVVDITLSVAAGALTADNPNGLQTCDVSSNANGDVVAGGIVNDGAQPSVNDYRADFPYLATPLPGSPNEAATPAP